MPPVLPGGFNRRARHWPGKTTGLTNGHRAKLGAGGVCFYAPVPWQPAPRSLILSTKCPLATLAPRRV